jgi:hypothetical protein
MKHLKKFNENLGTLLKCKKDLYKSTYESNAFVSGKEYEVVKVEDNLIWVKDEKGREFSFTTIDNPYSPTMYMLEDYFEK